MTQMITEQRRPSKFPDRAGWFYGRLKQRPLTDIHPVQVQRADSDSSLYVLVKGEQVSIRKFQWFGIVITVLEAA